MKDGESLCEKCQVTYAFYQKENSELAAKLKALEGAELPQFKTLRDNYEKYIVDLKADIWKWERIAAERLGMIRDRDGKICQAETREKAALEALHKIAYEPIGHAEASHREVLGGAVEIAKAAIEKATKEGRG